MIYNLLNVIGKFFCSRSLPSHTLHVYFTNTKTEICCVNWSRGNLRREMNFYCVLLDEASKSDRRTAARGKLIGAEMAARAAGGNVAKQSRTCLVM